MAITTRLDYCKGRHTTTGNQIHDGVFNNLNDLTQLRTRQASTRTQRYNPNPSRPRDTAFFGYSITEHTWLRTQPVPLVVRNFTSVGDIGRTFFTSADTLTPPPLTATLNIDQRTGCRLIGVTGKLVAVLTVDLLVQATI